MACIALCIFGLSLATGAAARVSLVTPRTSGALTAGAFSGGALVQQLPPSAARAQGGVPMRIEWDEGAACMAAAAAGAPCELRAFSGNASFAWDGVIGNSGPQVGPYIWRGMDMPQDMDAAGGIATYALGYNEMDHGFGMVFLNDTQTPIHLGHPDYFRNFLLTATDGVTGYFANPGLTTKNSSNFYIPATFVVGIDLATRCEHNFTVGGRIECGKEGPGQPPCRVPGGWNACTGMKAGGAFPFWSSALDYSNDTATVANGTLFRSGATGLAVQRYPGSVLAVAHAYMDIVRTFDKLSGALLCTFAVAAPRALAFDALNAAQLWAVTASGVVKFALPAAGSCSALVPVVTLAAGAVALPGDVSVGPRSNTLFVVDLATQQVRRFAGASGAALPPIGAAGGYTDGDPAVSAARFWFAGGGPFVAATDSPDETTFVNDPGNRRVLALARGGTGGELPTATVSYLARCYKSTVHPVNTSRVFANFIEYAVDAHASLASPGAWTLVRNWGAGLNASFQPNADAWGGFDVMGSALGRTVSTVTNNGKTQMVELVDAAGGAPARLALLQTLTNQSSLHSDGCLRYTESHATAGGAWQEVWEIAMTLDAGGAPAWEYPGRVIASFNTSVNASQGFRARQGGVKMRFPVTEDGALVVLLDASTYSPRDLNTGNHLGAARVGAGAQGLAWTASPFGKWDVEFNHTVMQPGNVSLKYRWIVPETMDGRYGANDTTIQYAASCAMTLGDLIVYGFFGEMWQNGEANQFLVFLTSGLFVGQFGTLNFPDANPLYGLPGAAGNSFSPALVRVGDNSSSLFLFHNDESAHDGVHRWRIDVSAWVEANVQTLTLSE